MPLITWNKAFHQPKKPTRWRRLAVGSWAAPNDPTLIGIIEINAESALKLIDSAKKNSGHKVTINHFVGKVFAQILKNHPEMNSELRLGKFYPRKTIDIAFQVAIEHEHEHAPDLSSGLVTQADQKSISEIALSLNTQASKIRKQKDPEFEGIKKISSLIPGFLQTFAVSVIKFILSTLNLWSPLLGVPQNAFGSMLITNVGSLGLDFAIPALFPPANVPMIIAVGAIYSAPVYESNSEGVVTQIKMEKFIRLCGAFDHRYIDGLHASKIANDIRHYFKHPELL